MSCIWLISDGNPGHYNQSLAIAESIRDSLGWSLEWITVKPRYRGFLRGLVRRFAERLGPSLSARAAARLFTTDNTPSHPPAVILSSGGKTAVYNALLARHYQCPNLFIGLPPLASACFTRILLIESHFSCDNCVALSFLPTPVSAQAATEAGQAFRQEHGLEQARLWTLLIGGNSRSHRYTDAEWRALAEAMNRLARHHGIRWLVTSSRRTGPEAEGILGSQLEDDAVAHATWWGARPDKVVKSYVGAAEIVFCTQDSLTMLTDGMAAGKPVIALYPEQVEFTAPNSQFFTDYIQRNVDKRRISRVAIAELASLREDMLQGFEPLQTSVSQEIFDTCIRDILVREACA